MNKKTFTLETLTCPSCTMKIEKSLSNLEGVESVDVLFNASKVKVVFNEEILSKEDISKRIENVGFEVLNIN